MPGISDFFESCAAPAFADDERAPVSAMPISAMDGSSSVGDFRPDPATNAGVSAVSHGIFSLSKYDADPEDPVDVQLADELRKCEQALLEKLSIARVRPGEYLFDGRRLKLYQSAQRIAGGKIELMVQECDAKHGDISIATYLRQVSNVAENLSGFRAPLVARQPLDKRLTFETVPGAATLNTKSGAARVSAMHIACQQARLREEAAGTYETGSFEAPIPVRPPVVPCRKGASEGVKEAPSPKASIQQPAAALPPAPPGMPPPKIPSRPPPLRQSFSAPNGRAPLPNGYFDLRPPDGILFPSPAPLAGGVAPSYPTPPRSRVSSPSPSPSSRSAPSGGHGLPAHTAGTPQLCMVQPMAFTPARSRTSSPSPMQELRPMSADSAQALFPPLVPTTISSAGLLHPVSMPLLNSPVGSPTAGMPFLNSPVGSPTAGTPNIPPMGMFAPRGMQFVVAGDAASVRSMTPTPPPTRRPSLNRAASLGSLPKGILISA